MRPLAFALAALVLGVLFGHPPTLEAQRFVGVRGGMSWAQLSGSSFVTTSARRGFTGSAFARIHVAVRFALQVEAGHVSRGISDSAEGLTADLSMDYWQFPVLLQFVLWQGDQSAQFYAGGAANTLRVCDLGLSDGSTTVTVPCDEADSAEAGVDVTDVDVSWVLGIGWQHRRSTVGFLFDVRGEVGQSDGVLLRDGEDIEENRNLSLTATVGVSLPIG